MLSLIFPSYKGSKSLEISIPQIKDHLKKNGIKNEIIVVDDGSDDKGATKTVAKKNQCIYLENKPNKGKGASVKYAVEKAIGDVIIYTDIDLPFGVNSITTFYNFILNENKDILIGDRTHPESNYFDKIPSSRKKASRLFTLFIQFFILRENYDTQCGLKAFKKEAAKEIFKLITIDRFAFDVEVLVIAKNKKMSISSLPVSFDSSQQGASANLLKQGAKMLFDLLKIRVYKLLGKYN